VAGLVQGLLGTTSQADYQTAINTALLRVTDTYKMGCRYMACTCTPLQARPRPSLQRLEGELT